MSLLAALRSGRNHVIGPVIGASAVVYFAYHAIEGERGMGAWWRVTQQIEHAEITLAATARERARLERRVRLMRPDSLDPDMLEEQVRAMLNYAHPDDVVIFVPER